MVTAIVLANARKGAVNDAAQGLAEMEGVCHVYSVTGRYDLVAIIKARDDDEMARLVTDHILKLDTIEKTTTLMAFETYSNRDLERMFSIGFTEDRVGAAGSGCQQ
jgi:DNA-binding Lrp family transcriptional regulator